MQQKERAMPTKEKYIVVDDDTLIGKGLTEAETELLIENEINNGNDLSDYKVYVDNPVQCVLSVNLLKREDT